MAKWVNVGEAGSTPKKKQWVNAGTLSPSNNQNPYKDAMDYASKSIRKGTLSTGQGVTDAQTVIPDISGIPTPSEVAKILRDDPAANIKKHQQNIDALTRTPSRHYNADVAKAVGEINRPSIYEYNQNSLNPLERVVVGSAAEKVRENKLLDLTAEEKKTLTQIAENMKKQYGASALYEYTGKEDIDMFDALWWITGAYQRTNSQSQAIYEGKKLERSNLKRTEYAVLNSDDFMEKVKKGTEYAKPEKQTENGGNFVERFVSDYLTDNGSGSKDEKRNKAFAQKVASGEGIYAYMTVDEKSVYYYFLGSNKNKAAADYIADLKPELESRKAREEADGNGFLENTLDAVGTGFVTGATNIARSTSALKAATNQDMSELEKSVFDTTYQEKLWSEIQANSDDRTLVGNLLLETLNSTASQVPAMLVGAASGQVGYFVTMSANIIGAQTTEAINLGYEAQQGFIHGLVSSALEIGVEKALGGFSSLLKGGSQNTLVKTAISAIDNAVENKFVANALAKTVVTLGQMGSEGVEEFLQEFLEPVIRNVIYNEDNKYTLETLKNALHAFAVGALSGGLMSAPYRRSAVSDTRAEILGDKLKETVNAAGGVESVLDLAKIAGNDSVLFEQVQEKFNNREDVDSGDVGRLYVESFAKFKNPNSKMAQAFVEQNVDGVIAEAKAMQSGEQTEVNSDLQSTAETVAEDSETALDKASELLEGIEDSDGLTEKQTDKISLEPKNPNKNHLDAATQKVYRDVTSKLGTEIVYEDVAAVLKGEGYEIDENNSPDGYIGSDGKIHLSYYSTNPTNFVLKHELTHYGERYNKEGYETYISAIDKSEAFKKWLQEKTGSKSESLGALKGLYRDRVTKSRGKLAPQSIAKLNAEMYADFSGEVIFNEERFDKFVKEINAKDRPKVIQFIIDFFKKLGEFLPKTLNGEIRNLESKYVEMLKKSEYKSNTETDIQLAKNGIGYDEDTQTAFSVAYVLPENTVDEVAEWVAERTGRSIEDAKAWVKAEQSLASVIYANAEQLDYVADQRYEAIKQNSDYPQGTIDLTNLCPKREIYTQMFDALQKIMPDKIFNAIDIANIRQTLSDLGIEVACGLCFVEDRRQLTGEIADIFKNMWQEAVATGKPVTKTNANGKRVEMHITKKLAKKYGLKQGAPIKADDNYIPTQYDLTTYQGFKELGEKHPSVAIAYEAYNNSRGMQAARLIEGRAEYKREILEWSDDKVKKVNSLGGLRIFSFSDFEAVHLIDIAQVIIDCAAKGVKIQGYTKRPDFLKLVKGTGIKLNVSHIPKGETGIKTVNGKKVLDYDIVEGINQKDPNYSYDPDDPDIGNVIVGINDEQIRMAMIDAFIDYIIPFHTNKSKAANDKLGTGTWYNYKNVQVDKNQKTGRKRNINIYTEVLDAYNPANKIEFVNAFLEVCRKKNMIPRYAQFLNKEYTDKGVYSDEKGKFNYVYNEGYHKFLVDFKLFDKSGNITPHNNIVPILNEGYMKQLLTKEAKKRKKYQFDEETFEKIKEKFTEAPTLEEIRNEATTPKSKYDLQLSVPATINQDSETDTNDDMSFVNIPNEAQDILDMYDRGEITTEERNERMQQLWEEAGKRYGQFPQGEKAVDDIPVPKKVAKDKPNRRFTRTMLESGKYTERMMADAAADILAGNQTYEVISDESAQKAADRVYTEGRAEKVWADAIANPYISKNTIAIGERLLTEALNNNDTAAVLQLGAELSEVLTRAGQVVQSARMFKKMTPLGRVMTVQKMADVLNKDLKGKYGDKAVTVAPNPLLIDQLYGAETEADIEAVMDDLTVDMASQVPATWLDKLNAWRYFAMLSNPRTHVRNLVGNTVFTVPVAMKMAVGTALETMMIRDRNKRTKTLIVSKQYRDFAEKDFKTKEAQALLKGTGQLDSKGQIMDMRKTFETEWLEKLTKGNSNLLEWEDMLFKSVHYKMALSGFLAARKIDLKSMSQATLDEARAYAVNEAKKATFQDASFIAERLNDAFRIPKWSRWSGDPDAEAVSLAARFMIEGVLPFKRTPINIVKRGVEYSPIGLMTTLVRGLESVRSKRMTVSEFCDGLAAGLTGTGVLVAGLLLASLGAVKGSFDDDEEDKFAKLNGEQEYSAIIGGKSYTIDWAAPSAIPFFIGVELASELDRDEKITPADFGGAVWNALEPMTNLSMLSGIQGIIDAVRYEDGNRTIASMLGNASTSLAMQLVPSLLGGVARSVDSTQRTWYTDKNSKLLDPFSQGILNNIKSKVPGLSYTQPASIDAWGREKSRGGLGERLLENFASPGYYSEETYSKTDNELLRLYRETDNARVFPDTAAKSVSVKSKTKNLTAKEWEGYAKQVGQDSFEFVTRFMESKAYEQLDDKQRAKVIERLYEFALNKARSELDYSYEYVSRIAGEKKNGDPILTEKAYNEMTEKAKRHIIQENFLSKTEIKYFDNIDSLIRYYANQAKAK